MTFEPFDPIVIWLAGKPLGKERVKPNRHFGSTHVYTPERTVAYEGRFALEAQRVMAGRPLLQGPLIIDVVAVMPIPDSKPKAWKEAARVGDIRPVTKPDWDNFGKILDALNMQVWVDDSQIVRGALDKFYGDRPMMVVRVRRPDADDRSVPLWAARYVAPNVFGEISLA